MKKRIFGIMMVVLLMTSVALGNDEGFRVTFLRNSSLTYNSPPHESLSIMENVGGRVISDGSDWEVAYLPPTPSPFRVHAFHVRNKGWTDFFWWVDTVNGIVYKVTGGTFGARETTQHRATLNHITVRAWGEEGQKPNRFTLFFDEAHLTYERQEGFGGMHFVHLRFETEGMVLSDLFRSPFPIPGGNPWQVTTGSSIGAGGVRVNHFELRHRSWPEGQYWRIIPSWREVWDHDSQQGRGRNWPVAVTGGPFTLTLSRSPVAGGTVMGGGQYMSGENVSLRAVPNQGYRFLYWRVDQTRISDQADFSYSMPARNHTLTAVFGPIQEQIYTLSLTISPAGAGSVTGGGQYTASVSVNLQAVANQGYRFVQWRWGQTPISNQANTPYTMPADNRTLTAYFEPIPSPVTFTLTLQMNPTMVGTVSGAGQFTPGTWVNIQATAHAGFQFTGWTRTDPWSGWPGVPFSDQPILGFQMPAEDLTLVANFSQTQPVPTQPMIGIHVENHPQGVVVTNVLSGYPAHGRIQPGDVLTHFGFYPPGPVQFFGGNHVTIGNTTVSISPPTGNVIQSVSHVQNIMANRPAGYSIALWVRRMGIYRLFVITDLGTPFATAYLF